MKHTNQYTGYASCSTSRKTIKIIRYKTFSGVKRVDIIIVHLNNKCINNSVFDVCLSIFSFPFS